MLGAVIPTYGFYKTNMGKGLITKLITDDDGSISKSLVKRRFEVDPEEFKNFLIQLQTSGFCLLDANPNNFLAQKTDDGMKFYIVEAYETLYPAYVHPLYQKRIQKRSARAYKRILDYANKMHDEVVTR